MTDLNKMLGLDADVPQIKLRKVEGLVAYHNNARTHSPAQIKQLQALMIEFGFTNPILVDAMGLVAGHGRTMAATGLYDKGKQLYFPNGAPIPIGYVPTIDCSGWTDAQRKAYILADNRAALSAGWDEELLAIELMSLKDIGFDLDMTAFSPEEIADLLGEIPEVELPTLEGGDRDPFEKMTFTVHDEQAIIVRDALALAKQMGPFVDTQNENSNGNALERICQAFVTQFSGGDDE